MYRLLFIMLVITLIVVTLGCSARRMAPFAPHRTNTESHQKAEDSQACLGCHEMTSLSNAHKATDDCLRCHRILYGDS